MPNNGHEDALEADVGTIGSNNIMGWKLRGCVGVVTNAGARDTDEIATEQMPLYFAARPRHSPRPQRDRVGQPPHGSAAASWWCRVTSSSPTATAWWSSRRKAEEVAEIRQGDPGRRQSRPPQACTKSSACPKMIRSGSAGRPGAFPGQTGTSSILERSPYHASQKSFAEFGNSTRRCSFVDALRMGSRTGRHVGAWRGRSAPAGT